MIQISKEEAMALRERYGSDVCIAITSRHKKGGRKKYYAEEARHVLFFIERMRNKQMRQIPRKNHRKGV